MASRKIPYKLTFKRETIYKLIFPYNVGYQRVHPQHVKSFVHFFLMWHPRCQGEKNPHAVYLPLLLLQICHFIDFNLTILQRFPDEFHIPIFWRWIQQYQPPFFGLWEDPIGSPHSLFCWSSAFLLGKSCQATHTHYIYIYIYLI